MNIMFKKIVLLALAVATIITLVSVKAMADASDSRAVIGADLTEDQVEKVYGYFGVARGDVTELTVTNSEEREYLSWLISDEQLGTLSISCVYIKMADESAGIAVSTHNIDWCTPEMYEGALLTAGIYDADIVVAAPFDMSGTAGLMGIYKTYEDITGTSLSELAKNAGLKELFVTGNLSDFIGSDNATYLIEQLKLILDDTQDMTGEELREEIIRIADSQNIELTETNITQIIGLVRTLEGLNVGQLREKLMGLSETFNKVKNTADGIKSFFVAVGDFFRPVGEFLEDVGKWFAGLFG
jgi:uncharacterized protein YpuA (DUF1002 family)